MGPHKYDKKVNRLTSGTTMSDHGEVCHIY